MSKTTSISATLQQDDTELSQLIESLRAATTDANGVRTTDYEALRDSAMLALLARIEKNTRK